MGSDQPLNILHVLAPAPAGGLESVVLQTTKGLRARGHNVTVAAVLQPGSEHSHPFVDSLRAHNAPVACVVVGARAYQTERQAIARLIREHDIHVVHTHGYRPDVIDGPVAHSLDRAHVTTLHGFVGGSFRSRLYERLQIRAARKADAAIAVSAPILQRLSQAGAGGHAHLVRNAVLPDAQTLDRAASRDALRLPHEACLVGWVGRVSHEKGPDVFVEALAKTPEWVHGAVIGSGPMMDAIQMQASALGVADRLHFPGMFPNARRYFAALDVLALTSRTEGTPMVLLEAMWAGVPILATSVGGIPDLLNGQIAQLCASEDATAIGAAMTKLASDPALRTTQSGNASEYVATHFDPDQWIIAYEQIYRTVARLTR